MAPKKKGEKMSLGNFLENQDFGSWADEMEDMPLPSTDRNIFSSDRARSGYGMGMGGGMDRPERRTDGYSVREELPLPKEPPYTAHLANLSFDVSQGEIEDFFRDCEVTSVRIVEDKMDMKPKGFGYVEFATLEGLKKALDLSGRDLAGRAVRTSVAEPPKGREGDNRNYNDWSRKGPLPELPGAQRRVSDRNFGNRGFDNMSDAGSEHGSRRGPYEPSDGKVRDFSNWERKGPLAGSAAPPLSLRDGGRQRSNLANEGDFRRNSPSWGEGRSQEGSRPPRREFQEKPIVERQPGASELDDKWRDRMQPAKSPTPETSAPASPGPAAAPTSRPRLNLAKRTVSEAQPGNAPDASGDAKASPFGAARPVDTATKERELEEKRQVSLRQKKEADEKARAEKVEVKRPAKETEAVEKAPTSPKLTRETSQSKEEGDEAPAPAPKFDILRRADSNTNDMLAEEEEEEDGETPLPTDDKAVMPKEVVVDPPTGQTNGSAWRGGSAQKQPEATTTTEALEEDGWSTVSKPQKQRNNRRSNNNSARALAS